MIDMNKQYKYRSAPNGQELRRILCVDRKCETWPIVTEAKDGLLIIHTLDGSGNSAFVDDCRDFDLIEVSKYDHIKKGDLVMCWDDVMNPLKASLREFSCATSQTAYAKYNGADTPWQNCELVQDYAEKYLK